MVFVQVKYALVTDLGYSLLLSIKCLLHRKTRSQAADLLQAAPVTSCDLTTIAFLRHLVWTSARSLFRLFTRSRLRRSRFLTSEMQSLSTASKSPTSTRSCMLLATLRVFSFWATLLHSFTRFLCRPLFRPFSGASIGIRADVLRQGGG